MRRPQPAIAALLALALLLGQWLAAAHGGEHAAAETADCAVCVYAHDLGGGALPSPPGLSLEASAAAPALTGIGRAARAASRQYPIRGPPAYLA